MGIYLIESKIVYSKLIDIKTKISLIKKYKWIFVISGFCSLLLIVGMVMLIKTAPKFIPKLIK
jgi:hydrogenase maturation factor